MKFEDLRVGEYVTLNRDLAKGTVGTDWESLFEEEPTDCVLEIVDVKSSPFDFEDVPSTAEVTFACVNDCGTHNIDSFTRDEMRDLENLADCDVFQLCPASDVFASHLDAPVGMRAQTFHEVNTAFFAELGGRDFTWPKAVWRQ